MAFIVLLLVVAIGVAGYKYYNRIFLGNLTVSSYDLKIPTGSNFDDVVAILERDHVLKDGKAFQWLAKKLDYPTSVRPGRYVLKGNMTNKDIVLLLRSGRQTPVKLVLNKFRLKADLCGFVSHNLEIDSAQLFALLDSNPVVDSFGLTHESSLALIMPNTYEFYWNTSPEKFIEKMGKEYRKFWTAERVDTAKERGLTPPQAMVLASIVEEETNNKTERPRIAGVYLNRMNKNMKLQADPTLKFAVQDFGLKRITGITTFESPYNTYLNTGLPPGPICTPSNNAIESVLNAESHKYLYFCAKYGSQEHNFSETYAQHQQYAREYHRELNHNNIY